MLRQGKKYRVWVALYFHAANCPEKVASGTGTAFPAAKSRLALF
jgi:hypothetical protein